MVTHSAPSSAKPLVVLVDDDPALLNALKFSLELEGFEVESCDSGEALLLRQLPLEHACLVIDERLPGITGLEALRQLRGRKVDLPALLITTNPGPATRLAASAVGVPIVEKPLLGDGLLTSIRLALNA